MCTWPGGPVVENLIPPPSSNLQLISLTLIGQSIAVTNIVDDSTRSHHMVGN